MDETTKTVVVSTVISLVCIAILTLMRIFKPTRPALEASRGRHRTFTFGGVKRRLHLHQLRLVFRRTPSFWFVRHMPLRPVAGTVIQRQAYTWAVLRTTAEDQEALFTTLDDRHIKKLCQRGFLEPEPKPEPDTRPALFANFTNPGLANIRTMAVSTRTISAPMITEEMLRQADAQERAADRVLMVDYVPNLHKLPGHAPLPVLPKLAPQDTRFDAINDMLGDSEEPGLNPDDRES